MTPQRIASTNPNAQPWDLVWVGLFPGVQPCTPLLTVVEGEMDRALNQNGASQGLRARSARAEAAAAGARIISRWRGAYWPGRCSGLGNKGEEGL